MSKKLTKKEQEQFMNLYKKEYPLYAKVIGAFAIAFVYLFVILVIVVSVMTFIALMATTLQFWGLV